MFVTLISKLLDERMSQAFHKVCEAIDQQHNVFISGVGGCGKTYLLKQLYAHYKDKRRCLLTSTTGISAYNLGGKTLHSWTRIILPSDPAVNAQEWTDNLVKRLKKNDPVWKSYRMLDLLFIDEVSMLGSNYLDALNYVCQELRGNTRPMGGLQLVLGGDMMQLPPVRDDFCFTSATWDDLRLRYFRLVKAYRFDHQRWVDLLQRARLGRLNEDDKSLLSSRLGVPVPPQSVPPIYLASRNELVDSINKFKLDDIMAPMFRYKAADCIVKKNEKDVVFDTKFTELLPEVRNQFIVDSQLELKAGCQVMLLANLNVEEGLTNGARGIVKQLDQTSVTVKFENGVVCKLEPHLFTVEHKYCWYGRQMIPLRLAFATSIHKSQSLTLASVEVDIGKDVFTEGQSYVALSRCKSLQGLYLRDLSLDKIRPHPMAMRFEVEFMKRCQDV